MNNSKKLAIGIAALALSFEADAITLSFEPITQDIGVGDPASVNIVVSDLGNLAPPSLGGFIIDVTYNAAVVAANSVTFGSMLDLGVFGSVQSSDLTVSGTIQLDEVSLEDPGDLNDAQPDSFVLATLGFTGLAPGLSPLVVGNVSLSDELGQSLDFVIETGSIRVTGNGGGGVPDAGSTALLLGGGLFGLLQVRKQLAAQR